MSTTLTESIEAQTAALNATILTTIPRDINGRANRKPAVFDLANVCDETRFAHLIVTRGHTTWSRMIDVALLGDIRTAAIERRQIQSPSGIPGFDLILLSGCTFVNLARATGSLQSIRYYYQPPSYLSMNEHGEKVFTQGAWMQEITVTKIRLGCSAADWANLKRRFLPTKADSPDPARLASELRQLQ